jgi:hypothetical protein
VAEYPLAVLSNEILMKTFSPAASAQTTRASLHVERATRHATSITGPLAIFSLNFSGSLFD